MSSTETVVVAAPNTNPSKRETAVSWIFDTSRWNPSSKEWDFLLNLIPKEEGAKVESYRFMRDKKLSIISRLLQRSLISSLFKCEWKDITITRTEQNKPFWNRKSVGKTSTSFNANNWNYNVSHHGSAVVIASDPEKLIGVDAMNLNERPSSSTTLEEFLSSFTNQLTKKEWQYIHRSNITSKVYSSFYKLWTLKEAYIKAVGVGLGLDLQRLEFEISDANVVTFKLDTIQQDRDWKFELHEIRIGNELYVVAVAKGPLSASVNDEFHPTSSTSCNISDSHTTTVWENKVMRDIIPNALRAAYDKVLNEN